MLVVAGAIEVVGTLGVYWLDDGFGVETTDVDGAVEILLTTDETGVEVDDVTGA